MDSSEKAGELLECLRSKDIVSLIEQLKLAGTSVARPSEIILALLPEGIDRWRCELYHLAYSIRRFPPNDLLKLGVSDSVLSELDNIIAKLREYDRPPISTFADWNGKYRRTVKL